MSTNHTPLQTEAIETADAYLNNACLPLYREVTAINAELLAALESLLNYQNLGAYERSDAMKAARAAISKAKGE